MKVTQIYSEVGPDGCEHLATVIRGLGGCVNTQFATDPKDPLQVGTVERKAGDTIPKHTHSAKPRQVQSCHEMLFVVRGRISVFVYAADGALASVVDLGPCEAILLRGGMHALKFDENSLIFEVRQGPYLGDGEKQYR